MGKQRLCLVIEDDPDIRGLIATVLEGAGFKVLAVDSGTNGIAAVARAASFLALITLDLGLPDMDGHDVARTLRAMTSAPYCSLRPGQKRTTSFPALHPELPPRSPNHFFQKP